MKALLSQTTRAQPTGPGSRGGALHDPGLRREYDRNWRHGHPDYREREQRRLAGRRRSATLARDRREVDHLVRLTPGSHLASFLSPFELRAVTAYAATGDRNAAAARVGITELAVRDALRRARRKLEAPTNEILYARLGWLAVPA